MSRNPFYDSRSRTVDQMIEKDTGTPEITHNTAVDLGLYHDYPPSARCRVFDRKRKSTTKKIPVPKRNFFKKKKDEGSIRPSSSSEDEEDTEEARVAKLNYLKKKKAEGSIRPSSSSDEEDTKEAPVASIAKLKDKQSIPPSTVDDWDFFTVVIVSQWILATRRKQRRSPHNSLIMCSSSDEEEAIKVLSAVNLHGEQSMWSDSSSDEEDTKEAPVAKLNYFKKKKDEGSIRPSSSSEDEEDTEEAPVAKLNYLKKKKAEGSIRPSSSSDEEDTKEAPVAKLNDEQSIRPIPSTVDDWDFFTAVIVSQWILAARRKQRRTLRTNWIMCSSSDREEARKVLLAAYMHDGQLIWSDSSSDEEDTNEAHGTIRTG
jgi:hypothetical protein